MCLPELNPNRDASWTIQGYLYQFDLTIERWLDLQPGQVLELECGEDIDVVTRALTARPEPADGLTRTVEQVKHRSRNLTLRHPAAVDAIASFIEHRLSNLSTQLFFRYTTNASVGRERSAALPRNLSGIEAWEHLRNSRLDGTAKSTAVTGIRSILSAASKPPDLSDSTWQCYADFWETANDDAVLDLILHLEWSTGQPQPAALRASIIERLLSDGHAQSRDEADRQYEHLLFYVIRRLSHPDLKQLTCAELSEQLAMPTLGREDRELLERIAEWAAELEGRVSSLEAGQEQLRLGQEQLAAAHTATEARIAGVAKAQQVDAEINYAFETPVLDVPPLVRNRSERTQTVRRLTESFSDYTWVAIIGSSGYGKTQLAGLVARHLCEHTVWVRMRDLNMEQACQRLDATCHHLAGPRNDVALFEWFQSAMGRVGRGAIVILDDLPPMTSGDSLSERLVALARACATSGVHLLTNSYYSLPSGLRECLPQGSYSQLQAPGFTREETQELLRAHGAPPEMCTREFAEFVNAVVRGHPTLLGATASYMHRSDWEFTNETLTALFGRETTAEVEADTVRRLLRTVTDANTRSLLWRLSLVLGGFSKQDAQALAAVGPAIEAPLARLHDLSGIWVQQEAHGRFMVSPLVTTVHRPDLTPEVQRACHVVVADRIVAKGNLNQLDVSQAVTHFVSAEEHQRAAAMLAFAFTQLNATEALVDDCLLLSIWSETQLPNTIDLGLRIYIRSLQVALRDRYDKNPSYAMADLRDLLTQASASEAWAVISAAVFASPVISRQDPVSAIRIAARALQLAPDAELPDGTPLPLPENVPIEFFVWLPLQGMRTADHVRDWLNMIAELRPEQRERAFRLEEAEEAMMVMVDRLWVNESHKPDEERRWPDVLAALDEVAQAAQGLDFELLWACAVRASLVVHAEYMGDIQEAHRIAEEALAQPSSDPRVRLAIEECLGRQFLYAADHTRALTWLERALSRSTNSYPILRVDALLHVSHLKGTENREAAFQYAERGVALARDSEVMPDIKLIQALGELAVATWLAHGVASAFGACDEAVEHLLASSKQSAEWRDAAVLLAHTCGFLASIASSGEPPAETQNGEPYGPPQAGMFLTFGERRAALFSAEHEVGLTAQLALFAAAVGEEDREAAWAARGMERATATGQQFFWAALARHAIPKRILEDRYDEAFELGMRAGHMMAAADEIRHLGRDMLTEGFTVEGALGPKPSSKWDQAEYWAAILTLLPTGFRLAGLAIQDRDAARGHAQRIIAICRDVSDDASNEGRWQTAAQILENAFSPEDSYNALAGRGRELFQTEDRVLAVLAYLGASLQENVLPEKALASHLSIVPMAQRLMGSDTLNRRVLWPFVTDYWRAKFARTRFRFRNPRAIEALMSEAGRTPGDEFGRAVLRAMSTGLGLRLPAALSDWLSGGPVEQVDGVLFMD